MNTSLPLNPMRTVDPQPFDKHSTMSIVNTPVLRVLYNLANQSGAQENETITFWKYLFNKIYFPEENWVVAQQMPPSSHSSDRRSRIDINIYVISDMASGLDIIAVFEGKPASGAQPAQVEEVESQALQACQARCRQGQAIWAITAVGTKGRVFKYTQSRFTPTTDPIDDEKPGIANYIDAGDPVRAPILDAAIRNIRTQMISVATVTSPAFT